MPLFFLLPVITVLALVLVWRTRGIERGLSIAIAVLSLIFNVWYFSMLFGLEVP